MQSVRSKCGKRLLVSVVPTLRLAQVRSQKELLNLERESYYCCFSSVAAAVVAAGPPTIATRPTYYVAHTLDPWLYTYF